MSTPRRVKLSFPKGFVTPAAPALAQAPSKGLHTRADNPAHVATLAALRTRADAYQAALAPRTAQYVENFPLAFENWVKSLPDQVREDSWLNVFTGHGTSRDKMTATTFDANCRLTFGQLEALYHDEDLAARIVDAEPEAMYRAGFDIHLVEKAPKPDEKQDLADMPPPFPAAAKPPPPAGSLQAQVKPRRKFGELEDELAEQLAALGAQEIFQFAQSMARLYGGGGVFVGANDGASADKPLNEERIKSVDFLHFLDRYSLWPNTFYQDVNSPKFGKPETYRVFRTVAGGVAPNMNAAVQDIVHESRLILFPGAQTTVRRQVANFSWDDSVLQRVYSVLTQFGLSWAAATHLLSDASQGVFKIKNLFDMITGGNKEELETRMRTVDMSRSTARMVMVDADSESFERTATTFTGIPDMLEKMMQRLAAAARMPVAVLMGMSPAGLNATGESDIRQWYDRVRTQQMNVAAPRLKRLISLLLAARGKTNLTAKVEFRPLYLPSPKERAEERKMIADTDKVYLDAGVLLEEEIRESHFGGDGYNPEITIDPEITGEALQAIKDARAPELPDPNAPFGGDDKPKPEDKVK